jgi:hypothetical protein
LALALASSAVSILIGFLAIVTSLLKKEYHIVNSKLADQRSHTLLC